MMEAEGTVKQKMKGPGQICPEPFDLLQENNFWMISLRRGQTYQTVHGSLPE